MLQAEIEKYMRLGTRLASGEADMRKHKVLKGTRYIVPREVYIKAQLQILFAAFMQTKKVNVEGYTGAKSDKFFYEKEDPSPDDDFADLFDTNTQISSTAQEFLQSYVPAEELSRHNVFCQVHALPIFKSHEIEPMKNGHIRSGDNTIERCLTLKSSEDSKQIIGAIDFTITLQEKKFLINNLGIDDQYQGEGFGSTLLHAAILTASLYGLAECGLYPSPASLKFYQSQGFYRNYDRSSYLKVHVNDNKLLDKMNETCPDADPVATLTECQRVISDYSFKLGKMTFNLDTPSIDGMGKHLSLFEKFKAKIKTNELFDEEMREGYVAKVNLAMS